MSEGDVPSGRFAQLHLSAGAPGITNVKTGVVVSAPNLKDWNDVPLRDMLQQKLGIPVIVENDTNLAAVGEHRNGAATDAENFIFVAMGTGVGAGVFLRGQLHHGAQWTAGEIGYFRAATTVRESLQVRQTGQLERIIGGLTISFSSSLVSVATRILRTASPDS